MSFGQSQRKRVPKPVALQLLGALGTKSERDNAVFASLLAVVIFGVLLLFGRFLPEQGLRNVSEEIRILGPLALSLVALVGLVLIYKALVFFNCYEVVDVDDGLISRRIAPFFWPMGGASRMSLAEIERFQSRKCALRVSGRESDVYFEVIACFQNSDESSILLNRVLDHSAAEVIVNELESYLNEFRTQALQESWKPTG